MANKVESWKVKSGYAIKGVLSNCRYMSLPLGEDQIRL